MSEDGRYIKWAFIGYPGDSLPDDYVNILDGYIIPWVESPVHAADSDAIKPHIHFMLDFGKSKKSLKQVLHLVEPLGVSHAIGVEHPRSMLLYFAHLNSPEKEQFSLTDLKFHGGACIEDYNAFTRHEIDHIFDEICEWCRLNRITEYSFLVDYIRYNGLDDWRQVINARTLVIVNYLKSARHGGYQDLNNISFDYKGEFIGDRTRQE